jgi:DNA-binding NtrC family response regulator
VKQSGTSGEDEQETAFEKNAKAGWFSARHAIFVHSRQPAARPFVIDRLARATLPEPRSLSDDAIERLRKHAWPGNVRELRNAIERAATLVRSPVLEARDFDFLQSSGAPVPNFDMSLLDGEIDIAVESLERTMIERALDAAGGNRTEAARWLGIHRQLLYKKLKQFGFE